MTDPLRSIELVLAAGGEAGPVYSAGMKIVDKVSWPVADLRCDWTDDCPIKAIAMAWQIYKPQLDVYIQSALDPREVPSYGAPGDQERLRASHTEYHSGHRDQARPPS